MFEQSIIKQDSTLCKILPEILKRISEFLSPNDVVHLSHTCKELHQKLPFYLKKTGTITFSSSPKLYSLFEGPAPNFSINEISICFTSSQLFLVHEGITVWIQIIRSGIVVMETQKYFLRKTKENHQIRIKDTALKEYKDRGRLRFNGYLMYPPGQTNILDTCGYVIDFRFQVSLQLENYKYGKPIETTKKIKGYADFKNPSVSVDIIEDVSSELFYHSCMDLCYLHDAGLGSLSFMKYLAGNTNF